MKGFFANIIKLLKGESSGSGSKHLATEAPTSTAAETKKAGDDTMAENRSIVIKAAGVAVIEDAPIPKLRDNYVIVKTKAVAINPTDWKHIDRLAPIGARVGCDYAGEVVEVGPNLSKAFEKGKLWSARAGTSSSRLGYIPLSAGGGCGLYIPAKDLELRQSRTGDRIAGMAHGS